MDQISQQGPADEPEKTVVRVVLNSTLSENPSVSKSARAGRIIVAEDQYMNIEVLKRQLTELDCIDRCDFYTDGKQTLD